MTNDDLIKLTDQQLKNLLKIKVDYDKKLQDLVIQKAVYKILKELIDYSFEPGNNLEDVRQYINVKMQEL